MYQELYDNAKLRTALGLELEPGVSVGAEVKELRELRNGPERNTPNTHRLEEKVDKWRADALAAWRKLDAAKKAELAETKVNARQPGGQGAASG